MASPVLSPQVSWPEHLRRTPRNVIESVSAFGDVFRYVALAVRTDVELGEFHPKSYGLVARHDLARAVEPWIWVACGLLPRAAVYRVLIHAVARSVSADGEDVSRVPAMEVAARWGHDRERVAAAERVHRHETESTA